MNEERFVEKLTALFGKRPDVITGIGDDAAVMDYRLPGGAFLLAAADQTAEGIHFTTETDAGSVAEKLLKRNISDIAAMGGTPFHALVTIALDPMDESWLETFHSALAETAAEYDISIVGGDTSALPHPGKNATLTLLGTVEPEKLCLRANAKEGDHLFLTGRFGKSFPTAHHLKFRPRLAEARFLAGSYTNAMMDVSDGLAKDLSRFAAASGLAADLSRPEEIPRRRNASLADVLNDGEDYELIFAVPPEKCDSLRREWFFRQTELTDAGVFLAGRPGEIRLAGQLLQEKGYDHFHEN